MNRPHDKLWRTADEDLMRLVAATDADAFEVLYDRHGGAAYALAHRICGLRPAADEVCQEAFLAVWPSGGRYDPRLESLRSWVLSIVHNGASTSCAASRATPSVRSATSRAPSACPRATARTKRCCGRSRRPRDRKSVV
jgi:RNA polymerase sigma-70 factor (ECF subfamily)